MIRVTIMEEEFGVVITTAPARASYREIELERDCYVPQLYGRDNCQTGRLVLIPVTGMALSTQLERWSSFGDCFTALNPENDNPRIGLTEIRKLLFEKLISKGD